MPSQLVQAAVICGITWILWKLCRQWVVKSPLDNIPGPSSNSWVYGNLSQLLALDSLPFHNYLLENYPGIASLKGSFGSKILYVFEPSALHHVFVKDQYIYDEGKFFFRSNELLLGKGLLATWGDHHRKQRKMLNPVFSPKHMRHMVPIFYDVGRLLVRAIDERVRPTGSAELDVNEWMGRTALEFVGQAGLGYSFDPLVNDKADEFASSLKTFSGALAKAAIPRRILPYLPRFQGPFAGLGHWLMTMVPHDAVQTLVALADRLWGRSTEIYSNKKVALERGESLGERVGDGKDIMSTLLKANMEASGEDKLAEEELIGQMGTLILAAVDTTSNALSLIMTRLAEHPDVQQKLREEIFSAGADKGLDFDALMGLPLLEAVCRETLRIDAPVTQVFREVNQDVVLPLSQPIRGRDGTTIHEIHVPKDTVVVAGLLNCNRNKAIWGEDAYEWKPERFLSPLPSTVTEAKIPGVYSNLMTFLAGGRACIGFKFSQLEMKVILSLLLSKFTFEKTAQPIIWNMAGVRYPSVGKHGGKASLPMKISLYKGAGD